MSKTKKRNLREITRQAQDWPTCRNIAEDYGVNERFVRAVMERGELETIKLDLIRVNPDSWEAWLSERYTPGK